MNRFLHWTGTDRAVVYGVLTRAWGFVAGPVTMLLIASQFTPEVQGYYYTFNNLIGMQILFELGLSVLIIQFTSHEWSWLHFETDGSLAGDPAALSRLVSVGQFALKWYALTAVLAVPVLGLSGMLFFSSSSEQNINWIAPWWLLCLVTGISLPYAAVSALLEGCNQVQQVYFCRFLCAVTACLCMWIGMLLGAGLWTSLIYLATTLSIGSLYLLGKYWKFMCTVVAFQTGACVSWRTEMWPMQWRLALSYLSGYFSFSLLTPILFHYRGSVVAGQMGMTWSLVNTLSMVSSIWVATKTPQFGSLIAQGRRSSLDRLAFRSGVAAFLTSLIGGVLLEFAVLVLYQIDHPLRTRLLPPLETGLFLLAVALGQIAFAQAAYVRAHKCEPFALLSLCIGGLIAVGACASGRVWGARGVAFCFTAIVAFFQLPFTTAIFLRYRAYVREPAPSKELGAHAALQSAIPLR